MFEPLRHRHTKGAATDMPDLTPPRHSPTRPIAGLQAAGHSSIPYLTKKIRLKDRQDREGKGLVFVLALELWVAGNGF
jgi:hypothetical protein